MFKRFHYIALSDDKMLTSELNPSVPLDMLLCLRPFMGSVRYIVPLCPQTPLSNPVTISKILGRCGSHDYHRKYHHTSPSVVGGDFGCQQVPCFSRGSLIIETMGRNNFSISSE